MADLVGRVWPNVIIPVSFYEDTAAMGAGNMMLAEAASLVDAFEAPCDGRVVGWVGDSEASADIDALVNVAGSPVAASAMACSGAASYGWFEAGVNDVTFSQGDAIQVETDVVTVAKDLKITLLLELDLRTR